MTTHGNSSDQQSTSQTPSEPEAKSSKSRLFILVGLLALALFALAYDYKVARPAVEGAYDRVAAVNEEINSTSENRRMTNADVQDTLQRTPSETFQSGDYTVEAYRWSAGMPLEFRGLNGEESPGIGLKTHDYYAVYRKDGPDLVFAMHFKFDLDTDELSPQERVAQDGDDDLPDEGGMDMAMEGVDEAGGDPGDGGGPGGPGGGGRGGFDPEAMFAERDADGDGKLAGDEISDRMRERLDSFDTDGDGAVSKEELLARMSQFRGGRGRDGGSPGGPGGGERGGEGRRQRPPLEPSDDAPAEDPTQGDAPAEETPAENPQSGNNAKEAETPAPESKAEPAPSEPTPEPAEPKKAESTKKDGDSE